MCWEEAGKRKGVGMRRRGLGRGRRQGGEGGREEEKKLTSNQKCVLPIVGSINRRGIKKRTFKNASLFFFSCLFFRFPLLCVGRGLPKGLSVVDGFDGCLYMADLNTLL